MLNKKLTAFTGITLGGLMGCAFIFFLGFVLPLNHPLHDAFGITKPQIVGFAPYWLLDKQFDGYENYLTTMTYFGLVIDGEGRVVKLVNSQDEEPGWTTAGSDRLTQKLESVKKSGLRTSLLVHLSDEATIRKLLENPQAHAQNLIVDVAPLLREKGYNDLNLDVESFREASASTRAQFTAFVSEVKKEIVRQNLGTLTIELTPISLIKEHLSDAAAIGSITDTVVLMAYDYHYSGSYLAGPVAPLGGAGIVREFDVETAVRLAVAVIPREKILLGIPLYGYEWETLGNRSGAATIPGGASTASHRRVEELLAGCSDCTKGIDALGREPFVIFKDGDYVHQIYYEDETSLQNKIDLAKKYQLGGIALWALGYEGKNLLIPLASYKRSFSFSSEFFPRGWLPRQ